MRPNVEVPLIGQPARNPPCKSYINKYGVYCDRRRRKNRGIDERGFRFERASGFLTAGRT